VAILNITNFDDHPEDPNWIVFRFTTASMATEFTQELDKVGIGYEQGDATEEPFLVGVKQRHREQAVRANYLVLGRHRPPFIADNLFRWVLLVFVAVLITLAIIGRMVTG
jgi:hypothetical protein